MAEEFEGKKEAERTNPKSKYGQRKRRRLNGQPSFSRSGESPPWWHLDKYIMRPDVWGNVFGTRDYFSRQYGRGK